MQLQSFFLWTDKIGLIREKPTSPQRFRPLHVLRHITWCPFSHLQWASPHGDGKQTLSLLIFWARRALFTPFCVFRVSQGRKIGEVWRLSHAVINDDSAEKVLVNCRRWLPGDGLRHLPVYPCLLRATRTKIFKTRSCLFNLALFA